MNGMENYNREDTSTTRKAKAYYAEAVAKAQKSPNKSYDGHSLSFWQAQYKFAEDQEKAQSDYNKRIAQKRSQAGAAENERSKAKDRAVDVRNKYSEMHAQAVFDEMSREKSIRGRLEKNTKAAKTKLKDLAKSYQDTYSAGMDMVVNFFKRK